MVRPPAPPGPPPPHYRPPGTPPPAPSLPPALRPAPAPPAPSGVGAGAVTAVAVVVLLVGLVAGFFLGRAYDDETSGAVLAPTTTARPPRDAPPTGDTIPQEAPTAPPSTDLAPAAIGTFEDPIPVGQAYVLGLYEIEVRTVDRDAEAALRDHEPSNPPAPDGRRHVLVEVAVRFTDPSGLGNPGSIPFFVSDGSAEWSAFDARCGSVPDSLVEAGLLEQGDEAVGNVCFTVPADVVDEIALGTESFAGPLWFALP